MFSDIFKYKIVNVKKLIDFGFVESGKNFVFTKDILDNEFSLQISISTQNEILTKVVDNASGDEYMLYLIPNAEGEFIGEVRETVRNVLQEICDKCFEEDVFKSKQAKKIIEFTDKNYGNKLEFLWKKAPNIAVLRRKDNNKWYAVLFVMSKSKLKAKSDEVLDVIDLRVSPDILPQFVDNNSIFHGYHMNKKHWISLCLDDSISTKKVLEFVQNSYKLAEK